MTRVHRLLLSVAVAAIAIGAFAPSVAASSALFPVQSIGNRGTDVKTIQWLLTDRGQPVTVDGIFGEPTRTAVKAFQNAKGIHANGVVGEDTWQALVRTVQPGETGPAVSALQRELRAKRHIDVPVDGVYGATTRAGVRTFQKHAGLDDSGVMTRATWRKLISHYELPSFNSTTLCDYSVGNGSANWGTSAAINQIEAAATRFAKRGFGRVSIGDVSFQHGGNIPLHETHEVGLDVDVRPIRTSEDQCRWGVNYRWSTYDRKATRALIKDIKATAPGHITDIYFNDPVLIREGLTTWFAGHDDHIHVRYCEKTHPLRKYDC
jgi:peptidoglycan hydrolase-like protein with peptidoglycan-binding domain